MKQFLEKLIKTALTHLSESDIDLNTVNIQIEATKDKQHGDYASNIALLLAKHLKRKPREIAESLIALIPASPEIKKIEIAGPGFINFFLTPTALNSILIDILKEGENFGKSQEGQGKRVLVEFVSTNPTGPLHVGHGRHASFGMVLADLLSTIGYRVTREYYVNDAGRQMDILAISVWMRYLMLSDQTIQFPANGYQGEYVVAMAKELQKKYNNDFSFPAERIFKNLPADEPKGGDKEIYIDALIQRAKELLGEKYSLLFNYVSDTIVQEIKDDLLEFGVSFDNWFSEKEFIRTDHVDRMFAYLEKKGLSYERDGAIWFRSTDFKDEKDRVLQRANGQRTYFANDLAYHINKFARGFDWAIDIFGSDHHGYIPRMRAGLKSFDIAPEKLNYLLLQFVSLYRGNEQVPMSTRSGSFVTLRELRNEVGKDAARFFYVMRRAEQPIDFDLELAKSESNENPVYYIQYAHARICSVMRQAKEKNFPYDSAEGCKNLLLLTDPSELKLLSTLSRYKEVIKTAAENCEPYLLSHYLRDLAGDFHSYYNSQQFIVAEAPLRNARLTLILATRQVIANGLKLIGVSIPESM